MLELDPAIFCTFPANGPLSVEGVNFATTASILEPSTMILEPSTMKRIKLQLFDERDCA